MNDSRKLVGSSQAMEKCNESETTTEVLQDLAKFDFDLCDDILAGNSNK